MLIVLTSITTTYQQHPTKRIKGKKRTKVESKETQRNPIPKKRKPTKTIVEETSPTTKRRVLVKGKGKGASTNCPPKKQQKEQEGEHMPQDTTEGGTQEEAINVESSKERPQLYHRKASSRTIIHFPKLDNIENFVVELEKATKVGTSENGKVVEEEVGNIPLEKP